MKKIALLGLGVCVALAFSSCKSSESAYKKAYEKAQEQELADATEAEEVAVVEETPEPVAAPEVVQTQPTGDVRQEKVTVVAGNGLKKYSVVCGSFGVKANADNLKAYLDGQGYSALVVLCAEKSMYRVVVSTFDDYGTAASARDAFKAQYPSREDFQGSWLLYSVE